MITFFEGLPRSGKSYSSMKDEIIPALQKGRPVYSNVEGLDFEKIAEVSGLPLERVQELLTQWTKEDVKSLKRGIKDSLLVIDEAQNWWPSKRQPLSDDLTEFVAEHGHDGLDIILMGQNLKDVHTLWRNRVERKLYFLKKTALGKPDAFSATMFTAIPKGDGIAFEKVSTSDYKYEGKYFGTYKSHTDGTENKETKVDPRVVVWNNPLFKKWLPIVGVVLCVAVYYVWGLFHGGIEKGVVKVPQSMPGASASPSPAAAAKLAPTKEGQAQDRVQFGLVEGVAPEPPKDWLQEMTEKHRIRFVGAIKIGNRAGNGIIEWRDGGGALFQSLTFRDIEALGYSVFANSTGTLAVLVKGSTRLIAASWEIDKREGRATESQQRQVSGRPDGFQAHQPVVVSQAAGPNSGI
ncbi:MAG: zonular occludens toxin family protein [Rhodocyclaceae bacterium]|nr:zonular occludens toxin family protein [Rhodocyclaceae bacterium]